MSHVKRLHESIMRVGSVVFLFFFIFNSVLAKPVDFELSFSHSGATASKRPLAHIFVLDRSGSMMSKDAEYEKDGRVYSYVERWVALKEGLRNSLKSTPNKTELRFIIIDSKKGGGEFLRFEQPTSSLFGRETTDYVVMSDEYRKQSTIESIIEKLGKPGGQTPLYDTLQKAFMKAWELTQDGKRVSVFVFSDGANVGGHLQSEDAVKFSLVQKQVPEEIVKHISFLPIWVSNTRPGENKLFDTDWVIPGTVPMVATVESSPSAGVMLDASISSQPAFVRLSYDFKVSDDVWSKIQKYTDELVVYNAEGKRIASHPVSFKSAREKVTINIDDAYLPATRDNVFHVQLKCEFPKGSYVFCDKPDPVRVTFAKAGEVSVAVVAPSSTQFVKSGEKGELVSFVAMVKPSGSKCTWDFGDGTPPTNGDRVTHRYLKSGVFQYSVRAESRGLNTGVAQGKIMATNASVSLLPLPPTVKVGEPVILKAVGKGPISRYVWSVAGIEVSGTDSKDGLSSEFRWTPEVPGKTAIAVRAIMKGELKPESDRVIVSVEAKPYMGIVNPMPGEGFEMGVPLKVGVRVVNVDSAVVKVYDEKNDLVATQSGSAIKDNLSEAMISLNGAGKYHVVAESVNGAVKSEPVEISVKAEQLKIYIDSPKGGEPRRTGESGRIEAHVTGSKILMDGCGGILWEVNGQPIPNGSGKVNEKGFMSANWTIPDEFGGKEIILRAYVLDSNGAKTPVFDEVSIEPSVDGAIELLQPSNNKHVAFGAPVKLEARTTGRVGEVAWFAEVEGEAVPIGTGKNCEYRVKHTGQKRSAARIYAKTILPGGSELKTSEAMLVAECPKVQLAIKTHPSKNGSETSYGLNEPIHFSLVNLDGGEVGRLSEIEWNMGDGTILKDQEKFDYAYTNYYTAGIDVSMSCKCALCEESAEVKPYRLKVEKQPPKAVLEILEKGSRFGTGDKITLSAEKSAGDISDYVWEEDGKELIEYRGKEKITIDLPENPCDKFFKLKVLGPDGSVAVDQRDIRIRNAWLAVLGLALLLLVIVVLAILLWGNGPAGWVVRMYCCERIDHSTKDGVELEISRFQTRTGRDTSRVKRFLLGKYWSLLNKKAKIPLKKIKDDPKTPKSLRSFISDADEIDVSPNEVEHFIRELGNIVWDKDDGFLGHKLNGNHYRQYRKCQDSQKDPRLLRFLLDDTTGTHKYVVCFVILTFCAIAAAAWAAWKYAI